MPSFRSSSSIGRLILFITVIFILVLNSPLIAKLDNDGLVDIRKRQEPLTGSDNSPLVAPCADPIIQDQMPMPVRKRQALPSTTSTSSIQIVAHPAVSPQSTTSTSSIQIVAQPGAAPPPTASTSGNQIVATQPAPVNSPAVAPQPVVVAPPSSNAPKVTTVASNSVPPSPPATTTIITTSVSNVLPTSTISADQSSANSGSQYQTVGGYYTYVETNQASSSISLHRWPAASLFTFFIVTVFLYQLFEDI